MSAFTDLRVSRVLFAVPGPRRSVDATALLWRWLRVSLFESYRPELHYMRGAGPKWREKHGIAHTEFEIGVAA